MASKKNGGFTIQQLLDRGFTQRPDGTWGKGDVDSNNGPSQPPAPVVEPDSGKKPARKSVAKKAKPRLRGGVYQRYQLVVVSYRTHLIDNSNSCVKYVEDAVVRAGFMPDDAPKFCPAPHFIQCRVKKGDERVELYLFGFDPIEQASCSR